MSFVDTRLKIRQWLKKYRRIIIITLIALAIVYVVNYILKNLPEEEIPKTFDPIVNYLILGGISLIIIVGIVIYMVKKGSKK